eukprot:TRINITY_DN57649_c0_g1_i1.p1 TRINITY_DN57649_c0_g1~~TRINITY_DN57649_c0_g1_i1.p1  ORF type:complete len:278 (+),score=72.50 TRINITY_DN57649_c0_g1_i1:169-1002(+)
MDDPYAVLRIRPASIKKEADLVKLKERAFALSQEYKKLNKHDKARNVEKAYLLVKERFKKAASQAGAQAFSKPLINRPGGLPATRKDSGVENSRDAKTANNPALAHFLKSQGAPVPDVVAVQQPPKDSKTRQEIIREKAAARRSSKDEKQLDEARRREAIRERLAAKRARQGGDTDAARSDAPPAQKAKGEQPDALPGASPKTDDCSDALPPVPACNEDSNEEDCPQDSPRVPSPAASDREHKSDGEAAGETTRQSPVEEEADAVANDGEEAALDYF